MDNIWLKQQIQFLQTYNFQGDIMQEKLSFITVKTLASLIALLIVYISVSGFMSLIGGKAGMVIGAIFGIAELAFIIFFPSTLIKWPLMSNISRVAIIAIITSLSLLSFASTTTYISKHMSMITKKADNNRNSVSIKANAIKETQANIDRDNDSLAKLKKELSTLKQSLIPAEASMKSAAAEAKRVMYNKGRNCLRNKECAIRYDIASQVLASTTATVESIKRDIEHKKQTIFDVNQKIRSQEKAIDGLREEIAAIEKHRVADDNAKKLYAGYTLVGSKINDLFHLKKNPIQTFTTMVALILYALYILLTIWMNALVQIDNDQIRNYRQNRKRNSAFVRLFKYARRYKSRKLLKELDHLQKHLSTLQKELHKKTEDLVTANDMLKVAKEREAILMRMAKPVTERVMVAVPENMTPSEAKKVKHSA